MALALEGAWKGRHRRLSDQLEDFNRDNWPSIMQQTLICHWTCKAVESSRRHVMRQ
jgi:hypothetical protein